MATADTGSKHGVEGLPVDECTRTVSYDGKMCQVPALSREQIPENPCYWLYKPPWTIFSSLDDRLAVVEANVSPQLLSKYESEIEVYCQCMQYLLIDLNAVLHSEYSKFWSHVIFDDQFHLTINNYIRMAPRWFDPSMLLTRALEALHDELHEVVFKLTMRMSMYRESRADHISPDKFSEYVAEFIYDLPKIVDLCSLYGVTHDGPSNSILRKMLKNVCTRQPGLLRKLDELSRSFLKIIRQQMDLCASSPEVEMRSIAMCVATLSLQALDDDLLFETCSTACEVSASLLLLLKNTPHDVHEKLTSVLEVIPEFFETVLLALNEELERRQDSLLSGFKDTLENMLRVGMVCCLEVFRHSVDVECMKRIRDVLQTTEALALLEKYYAILMQGVPQKVFFLAYNSLYPLEKDFDDLRQHPATRDYMDEPHLQYILSSLQAPITELAVQEENIYGKTVRYPDAEVAGAVGGVSDDVSSILAIFPDQPVEFIEKCLEFYNGNQDEVVTAIMDNNTHPELEKYRTPPPAPHSSPVEKLPSGLTVHIGKKDKIGRGFMDERLDEFNLKKIVMKYDQVVDEVVVQPSDKLYDDEYDDTYDSRDIVVPERSAEEESDRVFETPRCLSGVPKPRKKYWEQEPPEEELDDDDPRKKQLEFCEDPAVVRARREQRYQEKLASRGRQPAQQKNVVGNARGQGQSGEVLRNRALKERHKGANRKAQSDRKRREF